MRRALIALAVIAAPKIAAACCGLVAGTTDAPRTAAATDVVIVRDGTHAVVTIAPSYEGPAEPFALILPVPASVGEADVDTVPAELIARVVQADAPRLVETWEQDPCAAPPAVPATSGPAPSAAPVATTRTTAEYQITIVPAADAAALADWLAQHHLALPAGAAARLAPYVEAGARWLVARVDPAQLHFDHGHAALTPLRVRYDTRDLALPLALDAGAPELIVHVLAPHQRFRAAHRDNVAIASDLELVPAIADRFPAFYAALYDATLAEHPQAVVTEHAGPTTACDPCAAPALTAAELAQLGAAGDAHDFVLTRLHVRIAAPAGDLALEPAAAADPARASYVIRHPWLGPLRCEHPVRGVWGDPPPELARPAPPIRLAPGPAPAGHEAVALAAALVHGAPGADGSAHLVSRRGPGHGGCGCTSSDPAGLAVALLLLVRPKSRRARSTQA